MINTNSLLLAAALLLGVAVRSGEGIRCWVCSSDVDRRCGDPFNMTHLAVTDCDRERAQSPYLQSLAVCKKTKQRVNDELITVRSCTWETDAYGTGPCSANAISQYAKVEYCSTCSHDSCNGGPPTATAAPLAAFALLAASTASLFRH